MRDLGIHQQFISSEMHSEVLNVRFRPAQLVRMTKSGYLHTVGNKLPVCGSLGFKKTYYALLASDIYVCLEGVCLQLVVPTQDVFVFSHRGL